MKHLQLCHPSFAEKNSMPPITARTIDNKKLDYPATADNLAMLELNNIPG